MNMRNIVVLFSILLHCPIAWGTAYHVDQQYSNASDGNRGTADSPWKTLSKAAEILEPGDTVVVHSGVYREQVIVDGELLKQVAKLDDMAAGTFCAYTKGKVVLKGGTTKEPHLQCVRSSSAHSGGILCVFDSLP